MLHELMSDDGTVTVDGVAAIQASDFKKAQDHIDTVLSINRIDPEIAELLIPLLKTAGRDNQARALQKRLKSAS